MGKYLKKFETQAAYDAAQSGLILPNVSLTVDNNIVHYNPSTPVPPTPSFSVVAIKVDGLEWEDIGQYPYVSQGGGYELEFNRPVAFSELSAMTLQWGYSEEGCTVYQAETHTGYIQWGDISLDSYEGVSTTITLYIPDTAVYLCNINIQ